MYGLLNRTGGEIIVYDESGAARKACTRIASELLHFRPGAGGQEARGPVPGSLPPEEFSISCLHYLVRLSWVLRGKENALAAKNIRDLDIKARGITQQVKFLSGGNQQKVILSRWLSSQKRILLLDEPTRGVDVMGKTEIYKLAGQARRARHLDPLQPRADVGEVLAVADRIATSATAPIVRIFDAGGSKGTGAPRHPL